MNKNIKVSIVVAIYNSEKFLSKLISSILNQSHENLEVILVDDGSPDNSGAICDNFASIDDRIKVLHKINGGACDARNKGLELVTGEYLSIIDGDDWLAPDYIEYLLNLCVSTNSEMSMTDKIFTTRDQIQISSDQIQVLTSEEATIKLIYPFIPIGPWNKLYKTTLIKNNNLGFNVPWSGEGLFFSVMSAQYANHVALGHRKVYNYRLNNAGSGLTNYNVTMGINALWNIKNLGSKLPKKSKRLQYAVDWHIWKNYHFLLKLIIATNSRNKNSLEYQECLNGIRQITPSVLLHSEFRLGGKIRFLLMSVFPVLFAKYQIKTELAELKKDKMK